MALLRYRGPRAAPRISKKWPKPYAAFSASAISGTNYFDLADRAFYAFNQDASVILNGSSGILAPALRPRLDTGVGVNTLKQETRDPDLEAYLWAFTFSIAQGSVTASAGPVFLLHRGSTSASSVSFSVVSTGLRLRFGSLEADTVIVALADLPRAVPITLAIIASDTVAEVWMDGRRIYSGTPSQSWAPFLGTRYAFQSYSYSGSGVEAVCDLQQAATWTNDFSSDMARRLSLGPRELWEPEQIWVPVTAASTVPVLSAATAASITSSGFTPRVTITF